MRTPPRQCRSLRRRSGEIGPVVDVQGPPSYFDGRPSESTDPDPLSIEPAGPTLRRGSYATGARF